MGQSTLGKVIKTMLYDARIDGYFTGHSLRRSGTTRLFQAGVDKKIIKEITGHRSDAVDCYSVMSDDQKQRIISIIAQKLCTISKGFEIITNDIANIEENVCKGGEVNVKDRDQGQVTVKSDGVQRNESLKHCDIGSIVNQIIEGAGKNGKTVIKLEIEFSHD